MTIHIVLMNRQDLDALTSSLYIHRSSPNPTKTRVFCTKSFQPSMLI